MCSASSPNDPVFYLVHCKEDRIWAAWQAGHPYSPYLPRQDDSPRLRGHRIDDEMFSLLTQPVTIRQVLDPSDFYGHDSLDVTGGH